MERLQSLKGGPHYRAHLHDLVRLSWLALIVRQNTLAESGNLARHQRLGWSGTTLVPVTIVLNIASRRIAIALHRVPPFFTNAYFLSLTHVEVTIFGSMVMAAMWLRRDTQCHSRLMLRATVILMEPALGRLMPMPLLEKTGGARLEPALQVGFLGIMPHHDSKVMGRVHPATLAAIGAVVGTHALIQPLATTPAIADDPADP